MKKKINRRKKKIAPKIITMEDVYRLMNRVQIDRKEVSFALSPDDAITADNLLRDADLEYNKKSISKRIVFTIFSPPEKDDKDEEIDFDMSFFVDDDPPEMVNEQ